MGKAILAILNIRINICLKILKIIYVHESEFWLSCKSFILVALKSRKGVGSVEVVAFDNRRPPVKSGSRGSNKYGLAGSHPCF
jgi:hypothetical protein